MADGVRVRDGKGAVLMLALGVLLLAAAAVLFAVAYWHAKGHDQ